MNITDCRAPGTRSTNVQKVLALLPSSECVEWTGKLNHAGYGWVDSNITHLAHRYMYLLVVGPIELPELDHVCRNRACVNPAHLEPVTAAENARRRVEARTHCRHGHEYTAENTYWYGGNRQCRECRREQDRKRRPRNRRLVCEENFRDR